MQDLAVSIQKELVSFLGFVFRCGISMKDILEARNRHQVWRMQPGDRFQTSKQVLQEDLKVQS